jgi:hypothetical protein
MDEPKNNTEGQLKSEVSWENRESLAWDEHFFASRTGAVKWVNGSWAWCHFFVAHFTALNFVNLPNNRMALLKNLARRISFSKSSTRITFTDDSH